jgi:hypothetical protein
VVRFDVADQQAIGAVDLGDRRLNCGGSVRRSRSHEESRERSGESGGGNTPGTRRFRRRLGTGSYGGPIRVGGTDHGHQLGWQRSALREITDVKGRDARNRGGAREGRALTGVAPTVDDLRLRMEYRKLRQDDPADAGCAAGGRSVLGYRRLRIFGSICQRCGLKGGRWAGRVRGVSRSCPNRTGHLPPPSEPGNAAVSTARMRV